MNSGIFGLALFALLTMAAGLHVQKQAHAWKGYSPDCDSQCEAVGDVCDIGKEKICCVTGLCVQNYGLLTCSSPLLTFACQNISVDDQIATVINPKIYPNLYNPV